jgi:MOSC domain-containing protein YiiM
MSAVTNERSGKVVSLHLHPAVGGEPMRAAEVIEVVAGKGIAGNGRYFARTNRLGQPSRRQASVIEREQIAKHAATLGLQSIAPGAVRSNIETADIDLIALVGRDVQVGTAVLRFYEPRTPCEKMDRICQGLRKLMENQKQGVLAEVVRGGTIRVGDAIAPLSATQENSANQTLAASS